MFCCMGMGRGGLGALYVHFSQKECCCYTGEFGLVYKAYLDTAVGSQIVAVKTVKGIINDLCCVF